MKTFLRVVAFITMPIWFLPAMLALVIYVMWVGFNDLIDGGSNGPYD